MPSLESYTIVLRPDDNGTFVAYVPAIEGCHAWGQTSAEAKSELSNVFDMICDEYREEGKALPLFPFMAPQKLVADCSNPFLNS